MTHVGRVTSGQMVPDCITKQKEQTVGEQASNQGSSAASPSVLVSRFLSCIPALTSPWTVSYKMEINKPKQQNTFFPKLFLIIVFIITKKEHWDSYFPLCCWSKGSQRSIQNNKSYCNCFWLPARNCY